MNPFKKLYKIIKSNSEEIKYVLSVLCRGTNK